MAGAWMYMLLVEVFERSYWLEHMEENRVPRRPDSHTPEKQGWRIHRMGREVLEKVEGNG